MNLRRETGLCVKRLLDVVMATLLIIAAAPAIAAAAMAVFLRMGRPVLFRQTRPGLHERPFALYKLRTMSTARAADGALLPDGERLTPLGRALRRWSIDELPQLWNVLKGDMSLVGPRPLLMEYLGRYTPEQRRRHDVRPGITGWAQVNGRNAITWEEKLAYDVWYVENRGVWLDVKILARTAWRVAHRQGISSEGSATMPEFVGGKKGVRRDDVIDARPKG